MAKFVIQPRGRLHEWIAHEKDYFRDGGLDYEFLRGLSADTRKTVIRQPPTADYADSVAA